MYRAAAHSQFTIWRHWKLRNGQVPRQVGVSCLQQRPRCLAIREVSGQCTPFVTALYPPIEERLPLPLSDQGHTHFLEIPKRARRPVVGQIEKSRNHCLHDGTLATHITVS